METLATLHGADFPACARGLCCNHRFSFFMQLQLSQTFLSAMVYLDAHIFSAINVDLSCFQLPVSVVLGVACACCGFYKRVITSLDFSE